MKIRDQGRNKEEILIKNLYEQAESYDQVEIQRAEDQNETHTAMGPDSVDCPTKRADVLSTIAAADTPMDLSTNFSIKSEIEALEKEKAEENDEKVEIIITGS